MTMRRSLLLLCMSVTLAGCASTPPLPEPTKQQVIASTPAELGQVKFTSMGQWIPNSKEFDLSAGSPKIPGVVVVTDKAIVFQQWGGPRGFTVAKTVPFESIADVSLVYFGASARMVVQTGPERFDSFAASDGTGEVSIKAETLEMHRILSQYVRAKGA